MALGVAEDWKTGNDWKAIVTGVDICELNRLYWPEERRKLSFT